MLTLRDIGAEVVLLAGGGRAILMQLANPGVGHGVADHSDFETQPLDRLWSTMTYAYAVVYGTDAQRAEVRRRVGHAHRPVHSRKGATLDSTDQTTDAASGVAPAYNAFDPTLQLWVVATLYDSAITVYERVFGPLDDASADHIYRDYAAIGTALQVPVELWPVDRAAFAEYWAGASAGLAMDATTRPVARALLAPRHAPAWLNALMPLASLLTAGLLPAAVRSDVGMAWTPRLQRRFDRWMRVIAAVYPRVPRRVRVLLRDRLLARL